MRRQIHHVCEGAHSLACTQNGDYIVGSVRCILYKYSYEGHQIWEKELLGIPWYITVDQQDRIMVCLGYEIVIFDQDGEKMFAFPTSKDQRKLDPRGICVDSKDNILVSDRSSQSVLLYDNRGNFMRNILEIHGHPGCVGLYRDTHLVLETSSTTLVNKLCMYEISL